MKKRLVTIRILFICTNYSSSLRDFDFSCADEMLYPENHYYLSDLLSYVAVGDRSVENQQHMLTASSILKDGAQGMGEHKSGICICLKGCDSKITAF